MVTASSTRLAAISATSTPGGCASGANAPCQTATPRATKPAAITAYAKRSTGSRTQRRAAIGVRRLPEGEAEPEPERGDGERRGGGAGGGHRAPAAGQPEPADGKADEGHGDRQDHPGEQLADGRGLARSLHAPLIGRSMRNLQPPAGFGPLLTGRSGRTSAERSASPPLSSATARSSAPMRLARPAIASAIGSGRWTQSASGPSGRRPSTRTGWPGLPTTVEFGGTSWMTTELAPIFAPWPMLIGPSSFAPEPIVTLSSTVGWRLPVANPVPPSVTP